MGKGPDLTLNFGAVQIAIWSSEYKGNTNYSATIKKRYKKDGNWENTDFLNKNDILVASVGLQQAFLEIGKLQAGGSTNTNIEDEL